MFNTAGREPQQAPATPPGCLLLDGEALNWHEYEEEPQQQQPWQQQQQQRQQGFDSDSGSPRGSSERRQQLPARMSGSCSSPNLLLLADGSHTTPSMQQTLQEYPQQQQQQQASELLPMHSSQSCDSLLTLCHTAPSFSTGLGPLGSTAAAAAGAQSISSAGAAPKSRLGRPTGGETPRGPQPQQEQQQQQPSPETPQLTFQQQWQNVQDSAQQQRHQQQQQERLLGFSPIDRSADGTTANTSGSSSWRQQHGFSPQLQAGSSASLQQDECAVGASSGSARVTSWTFSRCSSGLSLGSEMLARRSLRVHTVTFNMNGKLPASLPPEMLGECASLLEGAAAADADGSPDLLVFATQVRHAPQTAGHCWRAVCMCVRGSVCVLGQDIC
jgi:hypothetical protein